MGAESFAPSQETALWWLTNAGFLINARGTLVMIDPVIWQDPEAPGVMEMGYRMLVPFPIVASQVPRLDLVLYTHADEDHLGPKTARELIRTGALFVGTAPVAGVLAKLGVPDDRVQVVRAGQRFVFRHVQITATPADHPWQEQNPEWGPPWGPEDCCGFVASTPDGTIWHPGDSRLMAEHLEMRGIDVLLLNVSNCDYHFGTKNAARLANAIGAPHIIAHHFGSYDAPGHSAYDHDPAEVAALIENAEQRFHIIAPGERWGL
jgi:L-ascorbate metabolism protein UlaG (beta-lactamase superfamily)